MSLFQVSKAKSAGKLILPYGQELTSRVVNTLATMSKIVGATLGPGGQQVIIERQEQHLPPIITKDGVTVVKYLGFDGSVEQLILEAAREAALRTASEAGDGTTTSIILSAAIVENCAAVIADAKRNSEFISPQLLVRHLSSLVSEIHQEIRTNYVMPVDSDTYEETLTRVANLSANGDTDLANATLEAFELVGAEGNMTIVETKGPSSYRVERIHGYTVDTGYEETLKKFANGFINDRTGTVVGLKNPMVVLFDGTVNDFRQIIEFINKVCHYKESQGVAPADCNFLLVAHGFSDAFVSDMFANWNDPGTPNILPLISPQRGIPNWRTQFLYDLQAYTGSPVFDVLTNPLANVNPAQFCDSQLATNIECQRYRTSIISKEDPDLLEDRVSSLKALLESPQSEFETADLQVRIGKLTSGIARMYISGPSPGETRERRDRAEDAWMAVRGAVKHGTTAGGGYVLAHLSQWLADKASNESDDTRSRALSILSVSLLEPVYRLYLNYGFAPSDSGEESTVADVVSYLQSQTETTFDLYRGEWVPKFELLDSAMAVEQAIENSVSIASLLGTLGGVVAYARDSEMDRKEAIATKPFIETE